MLNCRSAVASVLSSTRRFRGITVRASATASPSVRSHAKSVTMGPEAKARAKAAVLGGMVADAAAMPLHWIYDVPKMNELLEAEGRTGTPEFFPTPSCPFYQAPFGDQSCYGSELVPLLRHLADNSDFDADKYSQTVYEYFTTGTAYRNASIKALITNYEAGKRGIECGHDKDFQANCFDKAPLLVAKYGGQPNFLEKAEAAIRVQQNNDDAVKFGLAGARILEKVVVEGMPVAQALQWALEQGGAAAEVQAVIRNGLGAKEQPIKELQFEVPEYMKEIIGKHEAIKTQLPPFTWSVWCIGPACTNPAAFTNVVMAVASYGSYVEGVRANLMAGGDNCSRGILVGALLAAQQGLEAVPQEWREKTTGYKEYEALVDKMLA